MVAGKTFYRFRLSTLFFLLQYKENNPFGGKVSTLAPDRTRYLRVAPQQNGGFSGALAAPACLQGGHTVMRKLHHIGLFIALVCLATGVARAQSFRVQCPTSTVTHPVAANNNSEPAYAGPTYTGTSGFPAAPAHVNGAIKCQQISGGDGYSKMGAVPQTYMFSFGPLSRISDMSDGLPCSEFPFAALSVTPG